MQYEGILNELAKELKNHQTKITASIAKSIPNREDRQKAMDLAKMIFNVQHKMSNPSQYDLDLKELNQLFAKYGVDNSID